MPITDTTFCFLDYESTGISTRVDRPTQFACIRTDMDLNEIDQPIMVYCKPSADLLPNPQACLITGITPQIGDQHGITEHEFANAIEAQLTKPGTIALGFNTMSYDHELTRFMFWRNLLPPYDHEWRNECSRWDVIDVVRCCYALRPDGIIWPKDADGRTVMKLERLSAANGLLHESAHDALSDVRATIAVAKLIKREKPKLWDFCLSLRKKDAVIAQIGTSKPFLHISMSYGVERGYMGIVATMATHPTNKNEVIVWDLSTNPEELVGLSAQQMRDRMFVKSADLPEGVKRLPIRTIAINKAPIVSSSLGMVNAEVAARWGIDMDEIHRNADRLNAMLKEISQVVAEVFNRDHGDEIVDVEEDLYGGFLNNQDAAMLRRIRSMEPSSMTDRDYNFNDDRLNELVFRWRARNFPEHLSVNEQSRWKEFCRQRMSEGGKNRLSLANFYEQIQVLASLIDPSDKDAAKKNLLIEQLRSHGEKVQSFLD